ncbi:MAG: oligosaccharide flippase family protein [candidate division Zixibacteria bacterium]|nr:oligosaccharide flippase family protein [candidate division Zixibacteria bacterium]
MPSIIRQFSKNVFTSWSALGVRVVLIFLVNPFIIHTLGDEQYGVWMLVFSLINYLTIFDLGLKQALIRFVSKFLAVKDYEKINAILNTSFAVYALIGLATIAMAVILSFFVLDVFAIPEALLEQGRMVLLIVGLNVAVNFIMLSWGDSLQAFHRYDIINGLHIAEDVLRTATIVYLLYTGYGIVAMAWSFLLFSLLRQSVAAILLKKLHPDLAMGKRFIRRDTLRLIFNYSLTGFFISVAWLLIANTDNVIIGYFFDTTAVTKYAIAGSIIMHLRNLVLAVSFPLRPVISHYDSLHMADKITLIYTKGTQYLYYLTFAVAGGTLVFADRFIFLWLGAGYEQTATVLRLLVVPAAVFLPQAVANSVLYGIERHKHILYIIVIEGVANVGLSLVLMRYYGIYGVAVGTLIPQCFLYAVVMPRIIKRLLGIRLAGFYAAALKASATALGLSLSLSYAMRMICTPSDWLILAAEIGVVVLGLAIGAFWLIGRDDWRVILSGVSVKKNGDNRDNQGTILS